MTKLHHEDEWEVQRVESLLEKALDRLGEPLEVVRQGDVTLVTYAKWRVSARIENDADFDGDRYVDCSTMLSFKLERRPSLAKERP